MVHLCRIQLTAIDQVPGLPGGLQAFTQAVYTGGLPVPGLYPSVCTDAELHSHLPLFGHPFPGHSAVVTSLQWADGCFPNYSQHLPRSSHFILFF